MQPIIEIRHRRVLLIIKSNGSTWSRQSHRKGQATIPKAIRDRLGLEAGDKIKFFVHPDGSVVLLPKRPAAAPKGVIKAKRAVSIDEMNAAILAAAVMERSLTRVGDRS